MVAHHDRRVALGDEPHGNNFLVRRWLEDGSPEVVAIDYDHSTAAAWPEQLWEDHKQHLAGGSVHLQALSNVGEN